MRSARWQTASICRIAAGPIAIANTVPRPLGPLVDRHKVQQPFLVELVELPGGLKMDHIGQFFVGRGGKLKLTQLDAAPAYGDQRRRTPDAASVQFLGNPPADVVFRLAGRRVLLVPRNQEGVLDENPAAAREAVTTRISWLFHSRARS